MVTVKSAQTKMYLSIRRRRFFQTFVKCLKIIFLGLVALVISIIVFIKVNAPAAAAFTDNYLRPMIGDQAVIFLENMVFNLSDSALHIIYNFKKPVAPKFLDQSKVSALSSSLDLNIISPNPSFPLLGGEGVWRNIQLSIFPQQEPLAETFLRPDSARSYAIVSVVQIDTSLLKLGIVAGTKEPGGHVGRPGPGSIPKSIVQSENLVAAFNGGFLYSDGGYGMKVGKTIYVPFKNNTGMIVGYTDGSVKILNYTGQDFGNDIAFVRQNGPLLVENGEVVVTKADSKKTWGRVPESIGGGTSYTWRSGIGVTKTGNILYAAGNNLNPVTLAEALQMAGAVNAIQLDINPAHVRFEVLNKTDSGAYNSTPLNDELQSINKSKRYLNGDQRDFFYVYKK